MPVKLYLDAADRGVAETLVVKVVATRGMIDACRDPSMSVALDTAGVARLS